jgi:hypothetical protein
MVVTQDFPVLLETPRLILRTQSAADAPALTDLWADPLATRFLGGPRDRAWLQAAFEETARNPWAEPYDLWPVEEKETGRVVGHCGLLDKEVADRAEIELHPAAPPPVVQYIQRHPWDLPRLFTRRVEGARSRGQVSRRPARDRGPCFGLPRRSVSPS